MIAPNTLDEVAKLLAKLQVEKSRTTLPSRSIACKLVEDLKALLFPDHHYDETNDVGIREQLFSIRERLCAQIDRALAVDAAHDDCRQEAERITDTFISRLPSVKNVLEKDAQAAHDGDPSLASADEAIMCYPGLVALIHYRLAHELHVQNVPLIPRMMTESGHSLTGIDLHPGAEIGEHFFIDHGTGVVVGETAIIGNRVRLYQGVTLGAKKFPTDAAGRMIKGRLRHPIVEDDVIVYSWATILGRITIGKGSVIGGSVWVTRDVAPGSFISQAQTRNSLFSHGAGI